MLLPDADPFTLTPDELRARASVKWNQPPRGTLAAWVADMDCGVPDAVLCALRAQVERHDFVYPWRAEGDSLEQAFADRMHDRFGWKPDTARVQPVTDLVQGVVAALLAFSEPGDGVALQTPIYPPFLTAIAETGRRLDANALRDDGSRFVLDVDGLRRLMDDRTRILLVCNPHNPTGRVLGRAELEAVAAVAVERDLVIVCDEIHADLVYPGLSHLPMGTLAADIAERTVTITSATKSFNIPGLRCGVMHFGSDRLWQRFHGAVPPHLLGRPSSVGVEATVAAWRDGQPWLDRVLEHLRRNRDRVAAWVESQVPAMGFHVPEATYLAWLDCRALDLPGRSACRFFMDEAGVRMNPGEDFGPGGAGHVRLNFATSNVILGEILERMSRAIHRAGLAGR